MKKLVRIDKKTGYFIDIDIKRLQTEASNLLDYIQKNIDPLSDEHEIYTEVVPMCEKALRGEYQRSISINDIPLEYQTRERMLDPEFNKLFAKFSVTISGTPRKEIDEVIVNGSPHTYVEFEN